MMIKAIGAGSQDFGEPVVQLVKLSGRGLLGFDRSQFVKRASAQLVSEIDRLRSHLQPDEHLIHLLAIGATEDYGANRNGDGFTRTTCERHHPSFVKFARFYRSHKNKDPSKSYGTIKASEYNERMKRIELLVALNGSKEAAERNGGLIADEEMNKLQSGKEIPVSMACKIAFDVCFAAGTFVETTDGLQAIEQVAIGQQVRTHRGHYRQVLRCFKRAYAGTMVRIDIMGVPESQYVTASHPYFVARREQFEECHGSVQGKRRRHTVRNGHTCDTCAVEVSPKLRWTAAEQLRVGDFVVYPICPPGNIAIEPALAYLAGLYSGDGSPIRVRRGAKKDGERYVTGFAVTLDNDHPAVISRTTAAATSLHGRTQPVYSAGDGRDAVQVPIYHQPTAKFCLEMLGEGSATKRISANIFIWDKESRLQFLAGAIDSDGSIDWNTRYGAGRHSTTNRQLAEGLQKLWWGLGVPAGLHAENLIGFNGQTVTCYQVSVPRSAMVLLAGYSAKCEGLVAGKDRRGRGFLVGEYLYLPVQRTVAAYDELDVYNLSVEEDETYIAGVCVHNCSYCGNKAPSPHDYCWGTDAGGRCKAGGLRDNMGALVEIDGGVHQLHADNPNPLFFDISNVFRPADRIAYVSGMLKAASAKNVVSGAELARALGVTLPSTLMIDNNQPANVQKMLKAAYALEALEQTLSSTQPRQAELLASSPAMRPSEIKSPPLFREKLAMALRALADAKIMLPLEHFVSLVADYSMEKAAEVGAVVRQELPGIYGRLLADATLPQRLAHSPYTPDSRQPPPLFTQWASKLAWDCSLAEPCIRRRAQLAILRGVELPKLETAREKTSAERSPTIARMAEEYALYQLGFLSQISESDSTLPLTTMATVLHNHLA